MNNNGNNTNCLFILKENYKISRLGPVIIKEVMIYLRNISQSYL